MMEDAILINGKAYRVEVNMNVVEYMCAIKKVDDLTNMADIANMSPADFSKVIYKSLEEGAAVEGNAIDITLEEMKMHLKMPAIKQFSQIFASQVNGTRVQIEEAPVKKKKRGLFRWRK